MPLHRTCVGCGAAFTVPPSRLTYGPAIWCSQRCRYATPGWADALKPGRWRDAICAICGTPFRARVSEPGHYCSKRCVGVANGRRQRPDPSKRTTKQCAECGTPFNALLCLGERKKFCSRVCLGLWSVRRARVNRPTSIESALREGLSAVGVRFVPEMRVDAYLVDIAIPDAQIAIEADGTYWHARAGMPERDARKDAALAAAGWTVLRFSEDEINADVAACVATVLTTLRTRSR